MMARGQQCPHFIRSAYNTLLPVVPVSAVTVQQYEIVSALIEGFISLCLTQHR